MFLHQLQKSGLDTIHGRHRVIFRSDQHTHCQHAHCQHAHCQHILLQNNIIMADKHNIPKSNMHITYMLLLYNVVCTLSQRNNLRRANTCDPALKLLNEEITFYIQKHKQNPWKAHLDAHWHHRNNTHIIWRTIHGL